VGHRERRPEGSNQQKKVEDLKGREENLNNEVDTMYMTKEIF
jgi:hypothetical protein